MNQLDLFGVPAPRPPTNRLEEFCESVARGSPKQEGVSPQELATEFSRSFNIRPPVSLRDQTRLAETLGIREFKLVEIPAGAAGYNQKYGDMYTVFVNELDNRVRQEHTVFHELFELIQSCMMEFSPKHALKYAHPNDIQRERDADIFAASVLMPEESFLKDALESGLDVVVLKEQYRRAYSSILIQLSRTLGKLGVPFAGWLYEESHEKGKQEGSVWPNDGDEHQALARMKLEYRWTMLALSNRANPVLASHIPHKGESLIPGTLARLAFDARGPIHVVRATGFDFFNLDDLSLFVRPLPEAALTPRKIIVLAVRYDQRSLLQPQLASRSHQTIERIRGLHIPTDAETTQLAFRLADTVRGSVTREAVA